MNRKAQNFVYIITAVRFLYNHRRVARCVTKNNIYNSKNNKDSLWQKNGSAQYADM